MSADFFTKQEDAAAQPSAPRSRMSGPERAMVVIVAVTLTLACLMISSRQKTEMGQRPWRSGSVLQPLTQLLCLNFDYPTPRTVEVKLLVQGLGVAAALMVGVATWYVMTKARDPQLRPAGVRPPRSLRDRFRFFFVSAAPSTAAQIALVLFAGWTFLSALWAPWPAGAVGEGFRQLIPIVWAVVLGRTLKIRAARTAAMCLVGVLAVTAIIGIWYYYERNYGQRLKFPIGNSIFLAACLLPGLLLAGAWAAGWVGGLIRPGLTTETRRHGEERGNDRQGSGVPVWLVMASLVGFALMAWAFALAGERGPAVGLAGGIVLVAFMLVPKIGRWIIVALLAALLALSLVWVRQHLEDEGSRWATARFRTYAWRYAIDRMALRPVTGTGQGGYFLGAQAMSVADVEKDPAAFPGGLLGHAHSEWLEVLSDLGAAGFALVATAMGITLWGAGLAFNKLTGRLDRWTLLGLAGGLGGMMLEEFTDSTLRTHVFPLVFYTVVGLIWAMTAATEKPRTEAIEPGHSSSVRGAGLLLGILAAGTIAWISISDWQGARSGFKAGERAEKQDWDGALAETASAQRMRLDIQDRLTALDQAGQVAESAAGAWFGELRELIGRAQANGELPPSALQVARENVAQFDKYYQTAKAADDAVLMYMPYFMETSGRLAALTLMKEQKERVAQAMGLRFAPGDYVAEARRLLEHEYQRDPFNPTTALRLLAITPLSVPMGERLNLLRVPLRAGPVLMGVAAKLNELKQESDFEPVMTEWMAAARAAMRDPNTPWADRYAPETLRLAALVREVERSAIQGTATGPDAMEQASRAMDLAKESENLSEAAAKLLLGVRARFPTAAGYARADQAKYRLWASPYEPEPAVAVYRQAIAEWPATGSPEQKEALLADLSTFLLAAGHENQARANLRGLFPEDKPEALDGRVAACLQELGQWFISAPPLARPARFGQLVARWIELEPTSPPARLMGAQLALEQENDAAAMEHLDLMRIHSSKPQFAQAVRFLIDRFPDSEALQFMARRMAGQEGSQTRPARDAAAQPAGDQGPQPQDPGID